MDMFDTVAASQRGAWLHLTNIATGQPAYLKGKDGEDDASKPCRIHLVGMDSPDVRKKVKRRAAQLVKRRNKNNDLTRMSEDQIIALMDDGEGNKIADATDATIGWENLTGKDGKALEFSEATAAWLYEAYPAIARQVAAFLEVEANFFGTA